MRISEGGTNLTARNQPVRMCIARTLIQLMERTELDQIKITELVRKANVSRMTFYKYYRTKQAVLEDYMYEIVNAYMEDAKGRADIGEFHDLRHICHCFEFFKKYHRFILILVKANKYSVVIQAINDYMDTYVLSNSEYTRYELYYYAGALCNTYIKWIEGGMVEEPEEIARVVYSHVEKKRTGSIKSET